MLNQELVDNSPCDAARGTLTAHYVSEEERQIRLREAEARWEVEGVRRGVERYRRHAESKNIDELGPGQRLMHQIIPPLITAIEALRDAPMSPGAHYTNGTAELLMLLPADELAVITATTVMRGTAEADLQRTTSPMSVRQLSMQISTAVRAQIDFAAWSGDTDNEELLAALRRRYDTVTKAVWDRWRRKIGLARSEGWSKEASIKLGSDLIKCLVNACPEHFRLGVEVIKGGRTESVVKMSEGLVALLEDRIARAEVARPVLMPMICPPNEWRYCQ